MMRSRRSESSEILDHQQGARRVGVQVVARPSRYHREVRLRFRVVTRYQRALNANATAGAEYPSQDFADLIDDRRVPAALRVHGEELSLDQLEAVVGAEDAGFDRTVVPLAGPAIGGLGGRVGHRRSWRVTAS